MGWWQIKADGDGGIDHTVKKTLLNAIPGKDNKEFYYNGDTVADCVGKYLDKLAEYLKDPDCLFGQILERSVTFGLKRAAEVYGPAVKDAGAEDRKTIKREALLLILVDKRTLEGPGFQSDPVVRLKQDLWDDVNKIYQETWQRNVYDEERKPIINFVLGSCWEKHFGDQNARAESN